MTLRALGAVSSLVVGVLTALEATKYTHLFPGYGHIPNDDPLALAVGIVAGVVYWRLVKVVTK